ncbi:uncharacterized protein AAES06_008558 [Glossophaga mutica]
MEVEVLVTSTERGTESAAFSRITEDGMSRLDRVPARTALEVLHERSLSALILTRAPVYCAPTRLRPLCSELCKLHRTGPSQGRRETTANRCLQLARGHRIHASRKERAREKPVQNSATGFRVSLSTERFGMCDAGLRVAELQPDQGIHHGDWAAPGPAGQGLSLPQNSPWPRVTIHHLRTPASLQATQ